MPQSGVGSMQGSNEDCLPMKGHARGGDAPTMAPNERTHVFSQGGGRTHNVTQRTDTHIFTGGGRTHNVIQRTDTQIFSTNETKRN